MNIPSPWAPIELNRTDNKIIAKVWGRSYTAGGNSFLESIVSQGEELIVSPVRVAGVENGDELKWSELNNFIMSDSDGSKAVICSSAQSSSFVLNTSMTIEYDGCIDLSLSIMPQGRSVNEWFGLGEHMVPGYELNKLYLEIPFKRETAKFYQFYPKSDIRINGEHIEDNAIHQSGNTPDRLELPFKEQIYLGNDRVGLGVFFENDKNMQFADENCAIEVIKNDSETILRIHLLDSEPLNWLDKGPENGKELFPINYRIGLMATPVKEFPANPYEERNMHIDCFKKIPEKYEEFLMSPFENTDEIPFDRFKRLGVNTLYIHEKWNDIQNSPFITEETSRRLKLVVDEAHKRGIKVIPYFGYEIATLSPYWGKIGEEIMRKPGEEYYDIHWYRYPWQRDLIVCYNSKWQDIFVQGIEKLMDEYGFDGIYIDGTIRPSSCANESHGCGYRDKEGILHATYPVWAVRDLMKKLYNVVESRGGIINAHGSAAFNLAALPYCHSLWEGEMIQQQMMHGEIKKLPEGHFRSVFQGRSMGMPMYMLCYSNPPTWTFSQALAMTLPLGILPKPVDSGEPLEIMSSVWSVLDSFEFDGASWIPYYENELIESDNPDIKVSCWVNKEKYLILCANVRDCAADAQIIFKSNIELLSNYSSCELICDKNKIKFTAKTFDFAVISAKKI